MHYEQVKSYEQLKSYDQQNTMKSPVIWTHHTRNLFRTSGYVQI